MSISRRRLLVTGLALLSVGAVGMTPEASAVDEQKEIEAFNKKFVELHLKMDTAGVRALWAEDGVDLMPAEAPLIGKKTIVAWVQAMVSKMPGYKMMKEEVEFHDIRVSGDWASEWATEHQVVQPPEEKPPIEGYGKMMLVLYREPSGEWKIKQEMWNAGVKP